MEPTSLPNEPGATIWELTQALELNAPPAADEVNKLIELHGDNLPADYLEFIKKHDGASGEVGDNYLSIYIIDDVLSVAEVSKNAPIGQFLAIASAGYFHYGVKANVFYEFDPIDDEYQVTMGASFTEFLQEFSKRDWEDE